MFQIHVAPRPLDMVHCLPLLLFTSFLRNYYAGRGRLAPPDPCTHQLSGCRCNYLLNSAQLDFRTAQTYRTSAFGSNERKQHATQQPHRQDIRFQVADKTPLTYRTTHPPTDQTMHLPTDPPTMLQQYSSKGMRCFVLEPRQSRPVIQRREQNTKYCCCTKDSNSYIPRRPESTHPRTKRPPTTHQTNRPPTDQPILPTNTPTNMCDSSTAVRTSWYEHQQTEAIGPYMSIMLKTQSWVRCTSSGVQ